MTAHQSIGIRFDCNGICVRLQEKGVHDRGPRARAQEMRDRGTGRCGFSSRADVGDRRRWAYARSRPEGPTQQHAQAIIRDMLIA
jgi:hypothetical protein